MITTVDFVGRGQFERLIPDPDTLVVSIGDPEQSMPPMEGWAAYLRLEFLDTEDFEDTQGINYMMAASLVSYLQAGHSSETSFKLMVHCEAGVSRSAAVALIAEDMSGCDFPRRWLANYANKLVLHYYETTTGNKVEIPPTDLSNPEDILVVRYGIFS